MDSVALLTAEGAKNLLLSIVDSKEAILYGPPCMQSRLMLDVESDLIDDLTSNVKRNIVDVSRCSKWFFVDVNPFSK